MAKTQKKQGIGQVLPPVTIEYDFGTKGQRRSKFFDDAIEAKKFYVAKEKAGKQPKVLKSGQPSETEVEANVDAQSQPMTNQPEGRTWIGVRESRTRPYLAGVIIARHGLEAGVTDEMVAELDEEYGLPNPRESRFCLKNAWHATRGYIAH